MSNTYSLTTKHQVTIPKKIRQALGLSSHDRLQFVQRGEKVYIEKAPTIEDVAKKMAEKFKKSGRKPATDEEIDNARNAFYEAGGKW
jgi:AbrB family looped-hinge helix DNA binding protein